MFHDIRRASVYLELHELIRYIYDRTGYYDYVQALPGGERRKANLDLLRERAVVYAPAVTAVCLTLCDILNSSKEPD